MVGHETLYGYNIKDYKLLMVMVVAMLNVATILYLIEVSSVVSFSLSVVLLLLFFCSFCVFIHPRSLPFTMNLTLFTHPTLIER